MGPQTISRSESADKHTPVVIVGAGLAGLACARALHQASVPFVVLEGSDRVGGRVATDCVDGFQLDRGFQVLLTAYPEASRVFGLSALNLRPFYLGALVQVGSRRYRFADPWRRPLSAAKSMLAPIARMGDAWRLIQLRRDALRYVDFAAGDHGISTIAHLTAFGLPPRVIERFFRPFFGGVFLENELQTPSAFFRFIFSMFARGTAAVPSEGMRALPKQLAAQLPSDSIRLNSRVNRVESRMVQLNSGETIDARAVVLATDADAAGELTQSVGPVHWNSATTVYYAAPHSPIDENILVLNGDGPGLVNHVCVPSDVADTYAPSGQSLISVSIVSVPPLDDEALSKRVIGELRNWFGGEVDAWRLLRVYRIKRGLPHLRTPPNMVNSAGIIICGDHMHDPSINGALLSGRKAAEIVLNNSH